MKKYIFIIFLSFLLSYCTQDTGYDTIDYQVVSDTGPAVKEFTFIISLRNKGSASEYIVLPKIQEVELKLNNRVWANAGSVESDITDNYETIICDYPVSSNQFKYQIISKYPRFDATCDVTAGDYAEYLGGVYEIGIGTYIFEISKIKIYSYTTHTEKIIHPNELGAVQIDQYSESIYLGKFIFDVSL